MADIRFNEGVPPGAEALWRAGDNRARVKLLVKYFEYTRMARLLEHLAVESKSWHGPVLGQIIAQSRANTDGLVEYFDLNVSLTPFEAIEGAIDRPHMGWSTVVANAYDNFGNDADFLKLVVRDLSKAGADALFALWNEETPLAVRVNGTWEPTMTQWSDKPGPFTKLPSVLEPSLPTLLDSVNFETNGFERWPEELKKIVFANLSQCKRNQMVKIRTLKELAFQSLDPEVRKSAPPTFRDFRVGHK